MDSPQVLASPAEAPAPGRFASRGAFWRLWAASTTSQFGTGVTAVALPLVAVLVVHATTFQVGLVSASSVVAWLVIGLPAGAIVHRYPLRRVLLLGDVARALTLLSIPVAAAAHLLTLTQLIVVAVLTGVASVLFDVGYSTYLPSVLDPEQLTAGNSITQGSEQVAQIAGPALGGALVQLVGAANSLLADAASYVASAVVLLTVPVPAPVADSTGAAKQSVAAQIRAGLRYTFGHRVVGPLTITAALINFVGAAITALTAVFLVRSVHIGAPALVGALIATDGLGGVTGAIIATPLVARLGNARAIVIALCVMPVAVLLIPFTTRGPGLALFVVGNTLFGITVVVVSIVARTYRQRVVPRPMLPQVMATVRFVSWGALPIGAVIAGTVGELLGVRMALLVIGVTIVLAPIVALRPEIRGSRDLSEVA